MAHDEGGYALEEELCTVSDDLGMFPALQGGLPWNEDSDLRACR